MVMSQLSRRVTGQQLKAMNYGSQTYARLKEALLDSPLTGARALLGWHLVAEGCRAQLVEVEAYGGTNDPGSHAWRGQTPRNSPMFAAPGFAYVYFTYGMHWLLNVSAGPEGTPAAVLLRAARPIGDQTVLRARRLRARGPRDLLSGPGRLAQAFGLDGSLNGVNLLDPASAVHLAPGEPVLQVTEGPRVGLAVGRGELLAWRLTDDDHRDWVSSPRPTRAVESHSNGSRGGPTDSGLDQR